MRKCWIILGLVLALTGCSEANDIFGWDDYYGNGLYGTIEIGDNSFLGPVYIDATSWGSIAYINDKYVNKGIKLLVSEFENAEGGWEIDVTSDAININGLNAGVRYYYCLCIPGEGIKSEITSVVVPDVSALRLDVKQVGDSIICTIQDSIDSAFIQEKGFRFGYREDAPKYVVEGSNFAFFISDIIRNYSFTENLFYAYVQTANACYRSPVFMIDFDGILSDNMNVNREEITISEISEETIDDVDYLKCTVTGYVDSVYFYKERSDELYNRIYPEKISANEEGTITTFYVKKGFYRGVHLKAYYKLSWNENLSDYISMDRTSSSYNPTQFNIRNLDEFLEFVQMEHWYSYSYITVSLLADITLPSDIRLSINLSGITLDGNGHTLDGVSYFPLFRDTWYSEIKNLKIGTDETVYNVKKGTGSFSTTNNEVPRYFLSNGYMKDEVAFSNCEVRGTFKVTGRNDFYLSYDYQYNWSEEVVLPELKNYTKTEYVTTAND